MDVDHQPDADMQHEGDPDCQQAGQPGVSSSEGDSLYGGRPGEERVYLLRPAGFSTWLNILFQRRAQARDSLDFSFEQVFETAEHCGWIRVAGAAECWIPRWGKPLLHCKPYVTRLPVNWGRGSL